MDVDFDSTRIARFWSKVQRGDGCWEWKGGRDRHGYGKFSARDRHGRLHSLIASRVAWSIAEGPIPARLLVCHHCDNPPCVNPAHLFLGTHHDNTQDAVRKGRIVASTRTDFCPKGHPRDEANRVVESDSWNGRRRTRIRCRGCIGERRRRRRAAVKTA